jgi:hypothetical protein
MLEARLHCRLIQCFLRSIDKGEVHLIVIDLNQAETAEHDRTSPVEFQ